MKITALTSIKWSLGACTASFLLATAGPVVAQSRTPAQGQSSYAQQRQACNDGASWQDRKTCLREAGAARDAARRGTLYKGSQDYTKNALARCSALPQADRDACAARVAHPTNTSGSVADGGVLYEYREIVPAGTPGSKVIPGSEVIPAIGVTPGGRVVPGAVIELPERGNQPIDPMPAK